VDDTDRYRVDKMAVAVSTVFSNWSAGYRLCDVAIKERLICVLGEDYFWELRVSVFDRWEELVLKFSLKPFFSCVKRIIVASDTICYCWIGCLEHVESQLGLVEARKYSLRSFHPSSSWQCRIQPTEVIKFRPIRWEEVPSASEAAPGFSKYIGSLVQLNRYYNFV